VLSARKLKFWLPASFEPTLVPYTQNFEILKFLSKTQESKNLKFIFENINKKLNGSNFDKI
jgi:hypothetical protein